MARIEENLTREFADALRAGKPDAKIDPLGYANLSIALMRQQKFEEALPRVDEALAKSPGNPEILTIRGEILQWGGRPGLPAWCGWRAGSNARPRRRRRR